MTKDERDVLIAIIDGVTTTINENQFYEGEEVIQSQGIRTLKKTIRALAKGSKENDVDVQYSQYN